MLLKQILEQRLTHYATSFDTWQDSIHASAQSLIDQGFIESSYVDEIIACVEKYGPYIVIAPDIAMPHSTEGATGVHKTGIAFMKVETPVQFDREDREKDARLFFVFASENHEQHLANMMSLSEMLMNEEIVNELLLVKDDSDLRRVSEKYTI